MRSAACVLLLGLAACRGPLPVDGVTRWCINVGGLPYPLAHGVYPSGAGDPYRCFFPYGAVTVVGRASTGRATCTKAECPPGSPCCGQCGSAPELVGGSVHVVLRGRQPGCGGNSCGLSCPGLEAGRTYAATGRLVAADPGVDVEMDVEEISPLP